nr:hypothetical protein BaRGS_000562 [Batillaria attramentaria]
MLVAAIFGYKASQSNVDNEIPTSVKRNIGIHYGISVSCCSLCGIAAGNGGWGLGVCLGDDPKNLENCSPEHDLKMAFSISDLCINMLLLLTAIVGSVFFCRYARTFGLSRMQRMRDLEREVQELRAQVHAVNAHGQSNAAYPAAPPAYEYSSSTGQPEYQGGRFAQYGMVEKTKY